MQDFNSKGYLGKEVDQIIQENYKKHNIQFQFCEELNEFALSKMKTLKINPDMKKNFRMDWIVSLYLKIINSYQAVVIMYKYGFNIEAQIICRAALESLFYLSTMISEDEFYKEFENSDKKGIESFLNVIVTNSEVFPDFDIRQYKSQYDNLKANNKDNSIMKIAELDIAKRAGMTAEYCYAYKTLCSAVHPNPQNLKSRYWILEGDTMKGFDSLPSTEGIERTLYTVCHVLIKAMDNLDKYFTLSIDNELESLSSRLENIFKIL